MATRGVLEDKTQHEIGKNAQKQGGDFSVLPSKNSKRGLEKIGFMLYNYNDIGKVHKF